jgi:hypothetical protein
MACRVFELAGHRRLWRYHGKAEEASTRLAQTSTHSSPDASDLGTDLRVSWCHEAEPGVAWVGGKRASVALAPGVVVRPKLSARVP